jgi:hypothetical protein
MRPYGLAFADLSAPETPKPGRRLAELLARDAATLDRGDGPAEISLVAHADAAELFTAGCRLEVKDRRALAGFVQAHAEDGLIAYCYDTARGEAVLAFFHYDGSERARVVFKLQRQDPMKGSMLRDQRLAALKALESAFDFGP